MRITWQANSKGSVIFAVMMMFLCGLFAVLPAHETTFGADGSITETYHYDWYAAGFIVAALSFPLAMTAGRLLRAHHYGLWETLRALPFVALPPLWLLLVLMNMVCYARLKLGYWPRPNDPDPKEIGLSLDVLFLAGFFVLLLSTLWYAWYCIRTDRPLLRRHAWMNAGIMVAAWVVVVWIGAADPGDFLAWLAD